MPRTHARMIVRWPAPDGFGTPAPWSAWVREDGVAEVLVPYAVALDVYDTGGLLGTFVITHDATPADRTRDVVVPAAVRVHVRIRGIDGPRPTASIRGPDVVSLDPDDATGCATLDGR